jgi:hypothetical protein
MRTHVTLSIGALVVGLFAGCPQVGSFDGGIRRDGGQATGPTAEDIGTKCEYRSDGVNPTSDCGAGLTCLIRTYDGQYSPNPPGSQANFLLGAWEDHFTVYRADGVDEGYCTMVGTWAAPPACPVGTQLKLLSGNLAACLKSCVDASDCGRLGYTCDFRFLDVQGGTCVRGCTLDYPDCVRTGQFQRGEGQNAVIALHLEASDLTGASYCDAPTGLCLINPGQGTQVPGMPCTSTTECSLDSMCIQGQLLASVNPNLPTNGPGFCAQPCKPDPNMPLSGGCRTGFACQAGLNLGFGNVLDTDIQNHDGFLLVNSAQGTFLEAGGWCFAECQSAQGACTSHPGTVCGEIDQTTFGWPWNQVSMCLLDPLRQ